MAWLFTEDTFIVIGEQVFRLLIVAACFYVARHKGRWVWLWIEDLEQRIKKKESQFRITGRRVRLGDRANLIIFDGNDDRGAGQRATMGQSGQCRAVPGLAAPGRGRIAAHG